MPKKKPFNIDRLKKQLKKVQAAVDKPERAEDPVEEAPLAFHNAGLLGAIAGGERNLEVYDEAFDIVLDIEDGLVEDNDDWEKGRKKEVIKEVKRIIVKRAREREERIVRQQRQRRRLAVRQKRADQREGLKLSSLVFRKNQIPLAQVSGHHLLMIFIGKLGSMPCLIGKTQANRMMFNDILIAHEGKYIGLLEFAEVYDDEDGDYPIQHALIDAAIEAYYKVLPRVNSKTNKDKYLRSLATTQTPTHGS
jgi:hypothetical protein